MRVGELRKLLDGVDDDLEVTMRRGEVEFRMRVKRKDDAGDQLTDEERHIMEHATGWESRQPLYRNYFVTGEGTPDYPVVKKLCERGLMRQTRGPSEISGGMPIFAVTDAGIEELRKPTPAAGGKEPG